MIDWNKFFATRPSNFRAQGLIHDLDGPTGIGHVTVGGKNYMFMVDDIIGIMGSVNQNGCISIEIGTPVEVSFHATGHVTSIKRIRRLKNEK